jgi:hypothetical protein
MNKDIFSKKMEVIQGVFSFPITNNTTKEVTGFYDVEPFQTIAMPTTNCQ